MNKLIVKSTCGIFWGTIGSLASLYLANSYESKSPDLKKFLKNKLYIPIAFGGISGFILGYMKTPFLTITK